MTWSSVFAVACTSSALPSDASEDVAGATSGLASSNGLSLNGVQMNGVQMNGVQMNGVQMNGISLNGLSLNGVEIHGAELKAIRADNGETMRGTALLGATMQAVLSDGREILLEVNDIQQSTTPDVYLYTIKHWTGDAWDDLCRVEGGQPTRAIPLRGRWDYSSGTPTGGDFIDDPDIFTFACLDGALAKCVGLGYEPWKTKSECHQGSCQDVELRPLHQACTRLLRGDYCGDGTTHTTNGTLVNLWDPLNIQVSANLGSGWASEAEWGAEGALCIATTRHESQAASDYVDAHCRERKTAAFSCFGSMSTFGAAMGFTTPLSERSLLRNEFQLDDED
ncbi:ADYC domain-containing protein [Chondromyces crocatus]|uniref:ADYC domain-containing protein n=1 Tax=Chondromyces crocatus TaxID=52 RepID=UPI0012E10366|nr:ADYC domain-containing protein [Chondromyces crocatus]